METDPFFKLLALVLASVKGPEMDRYGKDWASVIKVKHAKIQDRKELSNEVLGMIGADKYARIAPILLLDEPE